MTSALQPVQFHFDHVNHVYTVDGRVLPHITGMLTHVGLIDDTWFTEESSERGVAVHDLTSAYDLGALDPRTLVSNYRGFVLGHVKAMQVLRPTHLAIEEPEVHPQYLFGGRPDRVSVIYNVKSILEIKSGVKASMQTWRGYRVSSHSVQTALQAILVSWRYGLPAHHLQRFALYERNSGRYELEMHRDVHNDFGAAMAILKECCHVR